MRVLDVSLAGRSYSIYIGRDLIGKPDLFERHLDTSQVLVVTNTRVAPLFLDRVRQQLPRKNIATVVLQDGEQYKTMDSAMAIFDSLLRERFNRGAHIIALGGGVVGDIAGFAAACYQRGIPFLQVPTTLLAQVDSSVGGKTAVNHPLGKNMIGAFYQPKCVIADVGSLDTLPDREFKSGLAEVIKYGLIRDLEFFQWLEANLDGLLSRDFEALSYAIERSCRNKAAVVSADERESGERATLNLGHTFGHAIETGAGYGRLLHGEAVAIGICLAAELSRRFGWLGIEDVQRIAGLLVRAGLPTELPSDLDPEYMLTLMAVDKKNLEGQLRLIALEKIGKATLPIPVESETVRAVLAEYQPVLPPAACLAASR